MKNKPLTKKIVMGKFKGKTLKLPSCETTRSSKNRVLESLFNTIQFDIHDSTFVEVFSGSGSIGLEALSRGASNVLFMEKDKEALKVLRQNISQTNPNQCSIYAGDSFSNISAVIKFLQGKEDEVYFYIDPPFSIREGMEDIYEKMLKLIESLPKDMTKMIIIEHMTGLEIPQKIGEFEVKKSKKFGNTSLTYLLEKKEE